MSIFDKIWFWIDKAFSWVDLVVKQYEFVRNTVPGIIEYIENLYDMFAEQINGGTMTTDEAREELVATASQKFSNSPIVIPKSFIRYVLELVHMHKTLPMVAVYDVASIKRQALDILNGLENKYGDR